MIKGKVIEKARNKEFILLKTRKKAKTDPGAGWDVFVEATIGTDMITNRIQLITLFNVYRVPL